MKYISSIQQLKEQIALGSKEPLLIGGELVFATTDRADTKIDSIVERYISQPPRTASRKNLFQSSKKYLYVALDGEAINMISAYPGDVMLAADQYLAFGLQQAASGDVIVLGGGERQEGGGFTVEGMVFTDQQLEGTFDRTVFNAYNLDLNLEDIVAQYPDHSFVWCSPLPEPPETDLTKRRGFKVAGDAPLANPIKRKIFVRSQNEGESWGLIPAIAVALCGFAVFAGAYAYQWQRFEAAKAEFQAAVKGYEAQYADSAQTLDLLRHRKFVLTDESTTSVQVRLLNLLIGHAASIPSARVDRVSVFDKDGIGRRQVIKGAETFLIELSVPQVTTAREQARSMLASLSDATGMVVQLIEHRPTTEKDEKRWAYKIGGRLNAGTQ